MIQQGSRVAIIGCSDPRAESKREEIRALTDILQELGLRPVLSQSLFAGEGDAPDARAKALMHCYLDPSIQAIFDVSGGDLANEILPFLDYDGIRANPKPFFGYSDLTTVLNAVLHKSSSPVHLYQVLNLVWDKSGMQIKRFRRSILEGAADLYTFDYEFAQGNQMSGAVIGGNLRCLLKLAGTPFLPAFEGKILFLESYGVTQNQVRSHLHQLRQMGVFRLISGLLLGTFTKLQQANPECSVAELALSCIANGALPVAVTQQIGHSEAAKCLELGRVYTFST